MKKNRLVNIAIFIIALFAICLSVYFYYRLRQVESTAKVVESKEVEILVEKVSKLYLLPEGEDPTIATVSDPSLLKDQSFFTLSEKGDKVLIYKKAGRAILYRPSIDKIIEVAPIKNDVVSKNNQDVQTIKEEGKKSN